MVAHFTRSGLEIFRTSRFFTGSKYKYNRNIIITYDYQMAIKMQLDKELKQTTYYYGNTYLNTR